MTTSASRRLVEGGDLAGGGGGSFWSFRCADRQPADAGGVRASRGAVPGVVRGAGPGAHGGRAAARGGLHPTHPGSAPTVKQHLAAIRMLGDWLVVSQVLPVNPAAAVRGPTHVVTKGAMPVLSPAEVRRLLIEEVAKKEFVLLTRVSLRVGASNRIRAPPLQEAVQLVGLQDRDVETPTPSRPSLARGFPVPPYLQTLRVVPAIARSPETLRGRDGALMSVRAGTSGSRVRLMLAAVGAPMNRASVIQKWHGNR